MRVISDDLNQLRYVGVILDALVDKFANKERRKGLRLALQDCQHKYGR